MLQILLLPVSVFLGLFAVISMIRSYPKMKNIFYGKETSSKNIVMMAIKLGFYTALIMYSIELFLMSLGEKKSLTTQTILLFISMPIAVWIICVIGFLWRVFLVGQFRDDIISWARKKNDKSKTR